MEFGGSVVSASVNQSKDAAGGNVKGSMAGGSYLKFPFASRHPIRTPAITERRAFSNETLGCDKHSRRISAGSEMMRDFLPLGLSDG
jgi:hypothetical protein